MIREHCQWLKGRFKGLSPGIVLEKKNLSNIQILFLSSFIEAGNNQFFIQLGDKRDNFPFCIVTRSYLRSNISSKTHHSTNASEIFKTNRPFSSKLLFKNISESLLRRLYKRRKTFSHTLTKLWKSFEIFQIFFSTFTNFIQ